MSAFLGPIHYWLYNKILWHEALLEDIYDLMAHEGHDPDVMKHYSESLYGIPEVGSLEAVIDGSNIHGWLQTKIHSLEYRMAYAITNALKLKYLSIDQLIELYRSNGDKARMRLDKTLKEPEQLFKVIYDYLLEGMPCDRINQPLSNDSDGFVWKKRMCIHTDFWRAVDGDINLYNSLRLEWIDAFVGNNFVFEKLSESEFKLMRRCA